MTKDPTTRIAQKDMWNRLELTSIEDTWLRPPTHFPLFHMIGGPPAKEVGSYGDDSIIVRRI